MLQTTSLRTVLVAILFCCLPLSPLLAQLSDAERAAKKEELQHLRSRIEKIIAERNEVRDRYSEVQSALRDTERQIGQHINELKQLDAQLQQQNRRLRQLSHQQEQLQRTVEKQRELLGDQVRAAFMIGRQEYLKLLLNQQDPAAVGRTMTYYRYFNQARQTRIEEALQSINQLARVTRRLEEEKQVMQDMRDQHKAKKLALEKGNQRRAKLVARLQQEISSKEKQITRLRQDEQQLKAVLEAIQDTLADLLPADQLRSFAANKGQLIWPAKGKVDNLYGKSRHKGSLKWNGVLIHASEGNTVYAVSRGRVAYADWLRGYGLLIILDHGDGYMSLYGHNQSLLKEVGDWVEANEAIASVGNSGGQQTAGLYFEIRHNGKPANPAKWCAQRRRQG